jgi:hypothetical protein
MKFRERKKDKEAQLMTKTKERQRKVTSRAKQKLHTENSKGAPPEQMQAPLNMWMQTSKFSEFFMKLTSSPPC